MALYWIGLPSKRGSCLVLYNCHMSPVVKPSVLYLSSDCDLDLDAGLNVDDDLLDNLRWGVETRNN